LTLRIKGIIVKRSGDTDWG